jgi:glycosyltransferase involved in cell wall biosynthesis
MLDGCDVVDNSFFEKSKSVPSLSVQPYVLFLGRLVWEKNLNFLIRSYFLAIKKGLAGVELHIVGSGPEKDSIVSDAIKCGIQVVDEDCNRSVDVSSFDGGNLVRFIPFVQVSDIPRIIGFSEALILPSISETWGLVVNESMAAGCPVICSNAVGCVDDLVINGVTGLVFSPENEDELADHIINVVGNPTLRLSLIEGGKRLIDSWGLSRFSSNATNLAVYSIRFDSAVLGAV